MIRQSVAGSSGRKGPYAVSSAQRPASAGQAGSAPLSGLRYFWSGRGLFRPGVVLLRSQRFRTKAWIINLSFLLPVIILAQGYFSSQRDAREVVLAELQAWPTCAS